ncbi:hypothetical protein N7540_006109 [Penicillium herquei]|nr:hypothetical protein N7540_006109 [Penicillium herquei]
MNPRNPDGQRRRGRGRRPRAPPNSQHMLHDQSESFNYQRLNPYGQQFASSSYHSYQQAVDQIMNTHYPDYIIPPGQRYYFPEPGQTYNSYFSQPAYEARYQHPEVQDYRRGRFIGHQEAMNARTMNTVQLQDYPNMTANMQLPVHQASAQIRAYEQPVMENQGQIVHRGQVPIERRRSQLEQDMIEGFRENVGRFEQRNAAVERLAARERERTARQSRHSSAQTRLIAEHISHVEEARRSERAQQQRPPQLQDLTPTWQPRPRGIFDRYLDRRQLVTVFDEAFYNLREAKLTSATIESIDALLFNFEGYVESSCDDGI